MPADKKYKKRKYKRRTKGRGIRRTTKPSVLFLKGVSQVPDTMFCYLKYSQDFTFVNVAGVGQQQFVLNSLFDPNNTGGGHQPLGFDQWSAFYNRYEVLSSSITIRATAPDVNQVTMAVYPSINSTQSVLISTAREQPYAKYITFSNTVDANRRILKNWMSVAKLEGRKPYSINYTAAVTNNPVNSRFWNILIDSVTATDVSDIICNVVLIYKCRFFQRNQLAQS